MEQKNKNALLTVIFSIFSILYVCPIIIVLINSFKKKTYISKYPFQIPTGKQFVGIDNYVRGMEKINFWGSFLNTLIITVGSVTVIILCTSMCAWYITRVNNKV
ncbi:MAG TPA: carbohydrate ABC transporter permease, partial [Lachnospiraceae bacterium]|nr:carbohydrate ABC transporter permease [Lachnospiraceae bacterium]